MDTADIEAFSRAQALLSRNEHLDDDEPAPKLSCDLVGGSGAVPSRRVGSSRPAVGGARKPPPQPRQPKAPLQTLSQLSQVDILPKQQREVSREWGEHVRQQRAPR